MCLTTQRHRCRHEGRLQLVAPLLAINNPIRDGLNGAPATGGDTILLNKEKS